MEILIFVSEQIIILLQISLFLSCSCVSVHNFQTVPVFDWYLLVSQPSGTNLKFWTSLQKASFLFSNLPTCLVSFSRISESTLLRSILHSEKFKFFFYTVQWAEFRCGRSATSRIRNSFRQECFQWNHKAIETNFNNNNKLFPLCLSLHFVNYSSTTALKYWTFRTIRIKFYGVSRWSKPAHTFLSWFHSLSVCFREGSCGTGRVEIYLFSRWW